MIILQLVFLALGVGATVAWMAIYLRTADWWTTLYGLSMILLGMAILLLYSRSVTGLVITRHVSTAGWAVTFNVIVAVAMLGLATAFALGAYRKRRKK